MAADFLAIAAGGAVGSLARYLIALWLSSPPPAFPWSTLAINLLGSFLLGFVARSGALGRRQMLFVVVGTLGSFTTFSALAFEIVERIERGMPGASAGYAAATMVLGIGAAWFGAEVSSRIVGDDGDNRC